jgi:rSAM/selenodomain-associated transferase 1
MSDRALVVFVRHPAPGTVKTRLAAAVGPEAAAELYRALAEHVLEATAPVPGEYERLVFFDPPEAGEPMRAWLPGVRLLAQSAGDLGSRMSDAIARAFARGASRVAIVGTDAPGLSRETVVGALAALDAADVVIGPTEDGGYYLLALREPQPELFAGIAWSTPAVRPETRARAAAAGLLVRELPLLRDVDTLGRALSGPAAPLSPAGCGCARRSRRDSVAGRVPPAGRVPRGKPMTEVKSAQNPHDSRQAR